MKNRFFQALSLFLCGVILCGFCACNGGGRGSSVYGENYKEENASADQTKLYGIGNLAGEENPEFIEVTRELIANLGAKSVRVWMHADWVMDSPQKLKENKIALFHEIIDGHMKDGMQVVVMSHTHFYLDEAGDYVATSGKVPSPSNKSAYKTFLQDYEKMWYNMAKEFSEVLYWEIHNEPNDDGFLQCVDGTSFGKDKAKVFCDMLYYASKGIHEANPNANTVMGGLAMGPTESCISADVFLEYMYEYIYSSDSPSKYADDYFQIAAWHPYLSSYTDNSFRRINNNLHKVITENEGKEKKVFLTEMGWSEVTTPAIYISNYMEKAFSLIRQELTYIESVHYFRMYDVISKTWGSNMEKKFGLFEDPEDYENQYAEGEEDKYAHETLGLPKEFAYTYQTLAGGSGALDLMVKFTQSSVVA